jgi:hypothetical protein
MPLPTPPRSKRESIARYDATRMISTARHPHQRPEEWDRAWEVRCTVSMQGRVVASMWQLVHHHCQRLYHAARPKTRTRTMYRLRRLCSVGTNYHHCWCLLQCRCSYCHRWNDPLAASQTSCTDSRFIWRRRRRQQLYRALNAEGTTLSPRSHTNPRQPKCEAPQIL